MREYEDDIILSREQVRGVDKAAIEQYHIPGIVLMENAARGAAELALLMLGDPPPDASHTDPPEVIIVCGGGNNGGDGYAIARHLHNNGCNITIISHGDPAADSDAAINRNICHAMKLTEVAAENRPEVPVGALVIDALLGTGLDRTVQGDTVKLINWINTAQCPVLAVDVPSGLDCDTGQPLGCAVRADATVTFVAYKPGLLTPEAAAYTGDVFVADIGAPIELIDHAARS